MSNHAEEAESTPRSMDIQAVTRAAQVLALFDTQRSELTVANVAKELRMNRTTAHRYLTSMEHAGLLARTESGYEAGPLVKLRTARSGWPSATTVCAPSESWPWSPPRTAGAWSATLTQRGPAASLYEPVRRRATWLSRHQSSTGPAWWAPLLYSEPNTP